MLIPMLLALASTSAHAQPPGLPSSEPSSDLKIVPYGFIKASVTAADSALGSYNNVNMSAPTFAVAHSKTGDAQSRTSFQVAQSRIGATMQKGAKISGRIEMDFIDFSKSSPAQQTVPRLRRALVTYKGEGWHMDIGQDWDLFAPTNPYTYDIVGLYFNAGNSGFQRQQIQYHRDMNNWQFSGAIGMATQNSSTTDKDAEMSNTPSFSVRAKNTTGPVISGVSAIYSRLNYTSSNDSWHDAYGLNAFFEREVSTFGLKAEVFYGQNLGNLNTLTLAKGSSTANVREWGGFLSANWQACENNKIFGGFGIDRVTNKQNVAAIAYDANNNLTSNGAFSNVLTRLGWEHQIEKDFSFMLEVTRFQTASLLSAKNEKTQVTHSIESGILWKF